MYAHRNARRRSDDGFTLVEVIVAMVVLSIVLTASISFIIRRTPPPPTNSTTRWPSRSPARRWSGSVATTPNAAVPCTADVASKSTPPGPRTRRATASPTTYPLSDPTATPSPVAAHPDHGDADLLGHRLHHHDPHRLVLPPPQRRHRHRVQEAHRLRERPGHPPGGLPPPAAHHRDRHLDGRRRVPGRLHLPDGRLHRRVDRPGMGGLMRQVSATSPPDPCARRPRLHPPEVLMSIMIFGP